MSYKSLEVWQLARQQSMDIHQMTLSLPQLEKYEEASQIRRSSKSTRANIVEGYGRRKYPKEYIKFVVYALASNDETIDHLETLFETKSITDENQYRQLLGNAQLLGKKLNTFLKSLEARLL